MVLEQKKFVFNERVQFTCWLYFTTDDTVWFKANELSNFFGYSNPQHAFQKSVCEEWRKPWFKIADLGKTPPLTLPPKWQQDTGFINERGLCSFFEHSKKQEVIYYSSWFVNTAMRSLREIAQPIDQPTANKICELQNTSFRPIQKLNSLEKNKPYKINGWSFLNIKYGVKTLVIVLDDLEVWAPLSMTCIPEEYLDNLVKDEYKFTCKGFIGTGTRKRCDFFLHK